MGVSPRLSTEFPIVPFDGFSARLNQLSPEAFTEVKNLLRKLQKDGPYFPELTDKYQTDFDFDTFTCYSRMASAWSGTLKLQLSPTTTLRSRVLGFL